MDKITDKVVHEDFSIDADIQLLYAFLWHDLQDDEDFRKDWSRSANMDDNPPPGTEDLDTESWHLYKRMDQFRILISAARRLGVIDVKPTPRSSWIAE